MNFKRNIYRHYDIVGIKQYIQCYWDSKNYFSKVSGFKINIQKSIVSLHFQTTQLNRNNSIYNFQKYNLMINLKKRYERDLFLENYKTLLKQSREKLSKCKATPQI